MIFQSSFMSGGGFIVLIIVIVIIIVLIVAMIIYFRIKSEKDRLINQIKVLSMRKSGVDDKEEPLVTDEAINSLQ